MLIYCYNYTKLISINSFTPPPPTCTQLPNLSSFTSPLPLPHTQFPNLSSFTPPPPPPTRTQLPNLPSVIKTIVVFTCHCVLRSMTVTVSLSTVSASVICIVHFHRIQQTTLSIDTILNLYYY